MGSGKLFVTYFNDNSESKIKAIKNYLDLFINITLNHTSIRSCLVSQPKNKLISYNKQLFNAINLLPITFGVILPANPRGKISTNSQNNLGTLDKNKILKYILFKYY